MKRGDLVLVGWPYSDSTGSERHWLVSGIIR
jgi:hypothetical protein